MAPTLKTKAQEYLFHLCNEIPNRRVGSEGNRLATAFFAEKMQSSGFDVECPVIAGMDWQTEGATISVAGKSYGAQASTYSLGIQTSSELVVAGSVAELENLEFKNKILFLGGELTREQFMPKNFPFFQVEEHQRIIQILEEKKPLAIITATSRAIQNWLGHSIRSLSSKMAILIFPLSLSQKSRAMKL